MKQLKLFFRAFNSYISLIILNYIFLFLFRLWEIIMISGTGALSEIISGFAGDIIIVNLSLIVIYIPFAFFWLWKQKLTTVIFGILITLFYLFSIPVQAYYNITGEIISVINFQCSAATAWVFSVENIPVISYLVPLLVFLPLAIYLIHTIIRQVHVFPKIAVNFFAFLIIIAIPAGFELGLNSDFFTKNDHRVNKPFHFAGTCINCTFGSYQPEIDEVSEIEHYQSIRGAEAYISGDEFPLLRKSGPDNCLSPYFRETDHGMPPNIILIVVEGLGNKFLNPLNDVSFMPFMNELKEQSLYWKNFLSTSDSLQNTLSSLLGGLPYGDRGFAILPIMPRHFSLVNILGFNNYHTSYFTGRHAWIHSTDKLLLANDIDVIWHAPDFGDDFNAIRTGPSNNLWGYNDRDLISLFFEKRNLTQKQPRLEIIHTSSMHNPWPVNNEEFYREKFRTMVSDHDNAEHREHFDQYEKQFTSIMFTDDVLRNFFKNLAEKEHYNNTIFVITGNYPMRRLASDMPLEKYHVPLLIYSPLLIESRTFENISSHKDFYDSFISLMIERYGITAPEYSASLGQSLCRSETQKVFIPFMDSENQISELLCGDYFLSSNSKLFKIQNGIETAESDDSEKTKKLKNLLDAFIKVNSISSQNLVPDSLFFDFLDYVLLDDVMLRKGTFRREFVDIIEEIPLKKGYRYYLDASFVNPRIPLEEVYLVYEITDEAGNSLIWKNFGIPDSGDEGFGVKETISIENLNAESMKLRVFLWNESPVPYEFDQARITLYRNK